MQLTRRSALAMVGAVAGAQTGGGGVVRYVRFTRGGREAYGVLGEQSVAEVEGGLFGPKRKTGREHKLGEVELLYPVKPGKVLAVGLNYKSHIGNQKTPSRPEIFYKPLSCLQHPGKPIVIPKDSKNTHYEAELVIVIGKRLKAASRAEAEAGIFGYTIGNDVSERDWQNGADKDLQWWRAKGADTFGPMGPAVAVGFEPKSGRIELRLNGEVRQKQLLSDLLFDCPAIVEFTSRYVTLEQGDVIYTGTPGTTAAMKPGDKVEVEIPGIGVLANPVVAG